MNPHPEFIDAWKKKIEWFCRYSFNIENWIKWRGPLEFEWKNSRRDTENDERNAVWTWAIHRSNHLHVNVQWRCVGVFSSKKRTMYCEFHDCGRICKKILGHWSFLGPGSEKKRCGSNTYQPKGEWEDVAEHMLLNFSESGPPVFRGTSALERGTLKSKGGGNLSFHFCGDQSNCWREFLHYYFRQSAQCFRSSSGFVWRTGLADFWLFCKHGETCCEGQGRDHGRTDRFVDHDKPTYDQCPSAGKLAARTQTKIRKSSRWSSNHHLCSEAGLMKTVVRGHYFCDHRRSGTGKIGLSWFMSGIHITSRWRIIQSR